MIDARAALLALLLAAAPAYAQPTDASDVAPPLRAAVGAYRAGDLVTAEQALRRMPGNPDAEAWLGAILVERGRTREALPLLQHAADAGSPEGAHRLALLYAAGTDGTPRNDAKALELFEKAAAAGHVRAQINAGTMYFRGQGTTRDLIKARAWLEKAAAQNDPYALSTRSAARWTKARAPPSPIRCAPPTSITAPRNSGIRWRRCATAWR
jgi:TPR repeat protein